MAWVNANNAVLVDCTQLSGDQALLSGSPDQDSASVSRGYTLSLSICLAACIATAGFGPFCYLAAVFLASLIALAITAAIDQNKVNGIGARRAQVPAPRGMRAHPVIDAACRWVTHPPLTMQFDVS
jgi:hypothetical protein